ncbi:ribosomal-protein-alanine N-acetyltransferase [Lachnotalea glycerini]|uniref:[Ribosomal protein bS18]-alanine N-acetyltransferase n=2 Tax=Lachnotalea glycerini TaxID=1763509 RepID=A0A371JHN0_9FIRM|nr:ribosomal-protein-alanine N-acetyltransferase [Lachnotalea glycerini]
MMTIIRLMTDRDIEQVSKIENETFSMPWSKDAFREFLKRKDTIYIVAEVNNEIVGYCGLWNIVQEGNINNFAVNKQYRKKHIGFEMLTKLIEIGNEQRINAYTLEVRQSNVAAIRLYHKIGFREDGIRKNFYESPREDAIIMWYR